MTNDDLVLPSNPQAEQVICGVLILDPRSYKVCVEMGLDVRDFFHLDSRLVYKTLSEYFEAIGCETDLDIILLMSLLRETGRYEKLGGGGAMLGEMLGYAAPGRPVLKQHIKAIQECSRKRRLMRQFNLSIRELSEGKNPDVVIGEIQSLLSVVAPRVDGQDLPMSQLVESSEMRLGLRGAGEVPLMPLGLYPLDRMLGGGIGKGHFCVIAARPGVGKTTFGLQVVLSAIAKPNAKVLYISWEMTAAQLTDRLMQINGRIDGEEFQKGEVDHQGLKRLVGVADKLSKGQVYLRDRVKNTVQAVTYEVGKVTGEAGGLDLIVLDYLQLMDVGKGGRQNDGRPEILSAITRGLKILAVEREVPLVALCQLNREVESRTGKKTERGPESPEPRLSDLKGSGSIEQDADQVIFLMREMDSGPTIVRAKAILAKHRYGKVGSIEMEYNNRIGCFQERGDQ